MTTPKKLNKVPIKTVAVTLNTYEVTCAQCQRKKWPSLPEPPTRGYVCTLCRSGAGKGRRHAARQREARARK